MRWLISKMPVPLPIYHYRSRDPEVFHQSHGWFQPSFLRKIFWFTGKSRLTFCGRFHFYRCFISRRGRYHFLWRIRAGGCTCRRGGVSAVGVTRGIEIVGGSMAGDGAAGIVSVCGSVLLFISTDTFFPML